MKNLIILTLAFFFALTINAQTEETDTTRVRVKNYEIIIVEDSLGEISTKLRKVKMDATEMDEGSDKNVDVEKKVEVKVIKNKEVKTRAKTKGEEMKELGKKMDELARQMENVDGRARKDLEDDLEELEEELEEMAEEMEELAEELEEELEEEIEEHINEEIERHVEVKKKGKYKLYSNWGGIGYGFESLSSREATNTNDFMDEDGAHSINWEFFAISAHLGSPYVAFTTGLGVEWSYRNLNKNIRLEADDDQTTGILTGSDDFTKNQLRQTVLNIPLMLEFSTSTNKKKNIKISAGYVQRIGVKSCAYYKTNNDGSKKKEVISDGYNLARYRGAVTGRLGYRGVTAFATYDLDQLFEDGKGPELYPLTFGVNFRIAPTIRWNTRKSRS